MIYKCTKDSFSPIPYSHSIMMHLYFYSISIFSKSCSRTSMPIIHLQPHSIFIRSSEFFNYLFQSITIYIDKNPSIKYSAVFIAWLLSTLIIPILVAKFTQDNSEKPTANEIINSYTTNNFYTEEISFLFFAYCFYF